MLFHKNIWQKCVQAFSEIAENSFLCVRPKCNGEGFCFILLSCFPFLRKLKSTTETKDLKEILLLQHNLKPTNWTLIC